MLTLDEIVKVVREGYCNRATKQPLYHDAAGIAVYRVLLHGLPWRKIASGKYRAFDGLGRTWMAERDSGKWCVWVRVGSKGLPHHKFRTLREAKNYAEDRARRMPWIDGAPW